MTGSNRTYLSRTINRYVGWNFNAYVNEHRIDEAVKTLSDTRHIVPLKTMAFDLRFVSLVTFYSYFRREVGMPPHRTARN